MHARAAYIRSFGTTGILLVASLLMLAMVGAVVGFHRWPGGTVVQNVPSVPLKPTSTAHLHAVRTPAVARVHKRIATRRARHTAAARTSTAGLVKVVPVNSPEAVGYPVAISPGHVGSAPQQAGGSSGEPAPQQRPPAPPPAPAPAQPIQQLVTDIVQTLPPPPDPPEAGEPLQLPVHVPLP